MKIGAQLYTVHEHTKTLSDLAEALKKVADIGYRYVQVSGTYDYEPAWLKEQLEKNGLCCVLTHTKPEKMLADPQKVAEEHSVFGCSYIGLGGMPGLWNFEEKSDEELVTGFLKNYRPVMQTFQKNGKKLMYHNHHYEFVRLPNGQDMIHYLAERTGEELGFTLDTYWVQYGGLDPAELICDLKGRVPCVHFKDLAVTRKPVQESRGIVMAPVGGGNLNWQKIIKACEFAGTEYALVEQDNSYGEDPFGNLKQSFEFLKAQGLEIE